MRLVVTAVAPQFIHRTKRREVESSASSAATASEGCSYRRCYLASSSLLAAARCIAVSSGQDSSSMRWCAHVQHSAAHRLPLTASSRAMVIVVHGSRQPFLPWLLPCCRRHICRRCSLQLARCRVAGHGSRDSIQCSFSTEY